jgi:hypothetical protein
LGFWRPFDDSFGRVLSFWLGFSSGSASVVTIALVVLFWLRRRRLAKAALLSKGAPEPVRDGK